MFNQNLFYMKKLSKVSAKTFNKLIDQLDEERSFKIDNSGGTFMPLSVEKLMDVEFMGNPATIYSLAHYFEQNGDLVPDPDMTFIRLANNSEVIFPASFQNSFGYREAIMQKENGWAYSSQELADQVSFANMWLRNIRHQQNL